MSKAVSALQGARFDGYVTIEEMGLRGMITVRGDHGDTKLKNVVTGLARVDFPGQGECTCVAERGIAWMSPDELLFMCPHAEAEADLAKINQQLAGTHYLAANVSDARAVFYIRGKAVREVLAKLAPVDMSPEAFAPGQFRRTRLAQAAAAFWLRDAETVELICFRSEANYVFDLLKRAAQPGSEVGMFQL